MYSHVFSNDHENMGLPKTFFRHKRKHKRTDKHINKSFRDSAGRWQKSNIMLYTVHLEFRTCLYPSFPMLWSHSYDI